MNFFNDGQPKFYEQETPEYVKIAGGEVRLYREAGVISFSRNPWTTPDGEAKLGKTVSVNLTKNRGHESFIAVLEAAISLLNGNPGGRSEAEGGETL